MTWEIIFKIIGTLAGLFITFLGIYLPYKLNKQKIDNENKEKARKQEADEFYKTMISKLDNRDKVHTKDNEFILRALNDLKDDLKRTNSRIDKLNQNQQEHELKDSILEEFKTAYIYTVNQILHFYNPENEKYKLILDNWCNSIEKFAIAYYKSKSDKINRFDIFRAEAKMDRMISGFYKLCNSMIKEYSLKVEFGQWLQKKNIHGKSIALSITLANNGFKTFEEVITLFTTYIYDFSTIYTDAVNVWQKLLIQKEIETKSHL